MEDDRQLIIEDVQRSISAVNDIVASLERDAPLTSDIIQVNYPQATVDEFLAYSQAVVDSMRSASERASSWLENTGSRLSQNLDEARRVEDSARETSCQLREAEVNIAATEESIRTSEGSVEHAEASLAAARSALEDAEDRRRKMQNSHIAIHAGAMIASVFFPIIAFGVAAVNMKALADTDEHCHDVVVSCERQLFASNAELDAQRHTLALERIERERLAGMASELRVRGIWLEVEECGLKQARDELTDLSKRINECLYAVNSALSSSTVISTMCSMRNVVTGIRGVVGGLGRDEMFAGPLALLDDAAFGALDRRVATIRRCQLTV